MDLALINRIKPLDHEDCPEAKSIQERLTEAVLSRLKNSRKAF